MQGLGLRSETLAALEVVRAHRRRVVVVKRFAFLAWSWIGRVSNSRLSLTTANFAAAYASEAASPNASEKTPLKPSVTDAAPGGRGPGLLSAYEAQRTASIAAAIAKASEDMVKKCMEEGHGGHRWVSDSSEESGALVSSSKMVQAMDEHAEVGSKLTSPDLLRHETALELAHRYGCPCLRGLGAGSTFSEQSLGPSSVQHPPKRGLNDSTTGPDERECSRPPACMMRVWARGPS